MSDDEIKTVPVNVIPYKDRGCPRCGKLMNFYEHFITRNMLEKVVQHVWICDHPDKNEYDRKNIGIHREYKFVTIPEFVGSVNKEEE